MTRVVDRAPWWLATACAIAYWLLHTTYDAVAAASLDPSWVLALFDAVAAHKDFSREFVFTHGPLGYAFLPYYYPGLYLHLVISRVLIGAALVFVGVAYPTLLPALLVMLLTTLGPASGIHAFAFCTIAWVAIVLFHVATTTKERAARWVAIVLIAAFAHAKFSFFVLAAPLLALVDGVELLERRSRWPRNVIGFAAMYLAIWVLAGQPVAGLPDYLWAMTELSGAYSRAMQYFASGFAEVVAFTAFAATIPCMLLVFARRRGASVLRVLAFAVAASWFGLVAFKSGFVRRDLEHLALPWHTVLAAECMVAAVAWQYCARPGKRLLVAAVALAVASVWLFSEVSPIIIRDTTSQIEATLAGHFAKPSRSEERRLRRKFERDRTAVLSEVRVEGCQGPTDAWPWDIAELILMGRYAGRPVVQSYAAYTPRLQALNARHLLTDPPQCALLDVSRSIDRRWPALDLGPDLLTLLSRYEVVPHQTVQGRYLNGSLLLRRVPTDRLAPAATYRLRGSMNEWFDMPAGAYVVRAARVRMTPTVANRIRTFFYKERPVVLEVIDGSGKPERYRFLPSLAGATFVLSPRLEILQQCGLAECDALAAARVQRFRFEASEAGFESDVAVELTDYVVAPAR